MAQRRLWLLIGFSWLATLVLFPLFPAAGFFLDPLFLILVFVGLKVRSGRFLWLAGMGLGFLKDAATAGPFGGWSCVFGLIGWLMGVSQHLLEREDPFIQGIWAGLLSGAAHVLYRLLVLVADPAVQGAFRGWWMVPFFMVGAGAISAWGFPRLERWVMPDLKRTLGSFSV